MVVVAAFGTYANTYNILISKEHNNYEAANGYTVETNTSEWTSTGAPVCESDITTDDVYSGYTANQTTTCTEVEEQTTTVKKVYKDGTEEIVSTDTVSRNIVNTSTTVINGTHVEQNCQDILAFNPVFQNQDGNYASTLNGSGMTIICDMTRDGGGWTKVAKVGNHIGVIESSSYLSTGHFLGSNNSSMAQKYFNDTNPEAILFLNTSSNPVYGTNDMLIVERNNASWGWTPSNYNNDANQTGRFYDASTNSWENLGAVIYASHSGNPWQESTFSFTINGMTNDYTGQYANRLVLGGTFTSGTTTGYTHSFYGTSYSEDGQVWYDNGEMEIWMK